MSSLTKGLILLLVILAIGAGLVFWRSNVGHSAGAYNSITEGEIQLLLSDVASVNPMALKRLKEDDEERKEQLKNLKELLAFASQAQKEGIANESPHKEELQNIRAEVIAVSYDKELNKDKGPMPQFGFITEDQVNAFWNQNSADKGWFQNFKDKIGLGAKDREAEFKKFLDSKVAILRADNPAMKDREISEEERNQAREFFAKIRIYLDEYEQKAKAGQLPKEFQDKVNLQVKLQQAQFLARQYSEKITEKAKVTDEEVDKYIASHPELNPTEKRTQAEDILNRAKNGEDFGALAKEFSGDPGSKDKGGLYENVRLGQMVKPFEDAALSVQAGQVVPNIVETDFGYHIIKLESRNAAPAEKPEANANTAAAAPPAGETYSVRHILISTGYKDPENPMGREMPIKQYARAKLEEEKQKKLIDEIVAANNVQVPDDFAVPEVSEEQIKESMERQQKQMEQMNMPGEEDEDAPAAANSNTSKPAAKPAPKKR